MVLTAAAAPSHPAIPPTLSRPFYTTSNRYNKLSKPQERIKYALVDYSELEVGTSIAYYDLMRISCGVGGPPPRLRIPVTPTPP